MAAPCPLKPVFGGLPRADEHGRIVDEPASYDEEERQIVALRGPLSQFLKDAKRFVTDFGTPSQKQRFSENTLVEVAFLNRPPGAEIIRKLTALPTCEVFNAWLRSSPMERPGNWRTPAARSGSPLPGAPVNPVST
jgi:hypothetical protein